MRRLPTITIALLLATPVLFSASRAVRADIYRYVDDEGVESFTDAPRSRGATLVMKEQSALRPAGGKRTVPKHLAATGIAEKPSPATAAGSQRAAFPGSLPVPGRITSLVGPRHDPIDGTMREHNGIDIAVCEGTPIRPVSPGRVLFAGVRPGYGTMVIVEHGDGTITLYAHNSVNLVAEGDTVGDTTTIALSGSTGRSTGPHLHFEAWKDGMNVTASFIPGGRGEAVGASGGPRRAADAIRRIVQADGTIFFTNH